MKNFCKREITDPFQISKNNGSVSCSCFLYHEFIGFFRIAVIKMTKGFIQQQNINWLHHGPDDGNPLLFSVRTYPAFCLQFISNTQPFGHFPDLFRWVKGIELSFDIDIIIHGFFRKRVIDLLSVNAFA